MRTPGAGVCSAPSDWPSIAFLYWNSVKSGIWSVRWRSHADASARHGAETNPL